MFKRVVTLLLVPTVLLTQWASAGQCHGCPHGTGHDSAPHVHWMGLPCIGIVPCSEGQSDPRCQGCSHRHEDEPDGDPDPSDQECNHPHDGVPVHREGDSTGHHGGSVVYLPTALLHGWLTGRSALRLDQGVDVHALALDDHVRISIPPRAGTGASLPFLTPSDGPASSRALPLLI